jgi:CBS-domain-containing membrane protein
MNIAFFLTPKHEVICESLNSTMRQAIERMEFHSYTAIPVIDDKGKYIGTLTEGDLLWKLKDNPELNFKNSNKILISEIPRKTINKPVSINADMESLISLAISQNFVPVVDDDGIFIGIIKRSDIINYCYKRIKRTESIQNI